MEENDFIFIKGKNEELSKFEVLSYLDSRNYEYKILDDTADFIILKLLDQIDLEKMIKSLGGTLKVANVLLVSSKNELKNTLEKAELTKFFKSSEKRLIFGVSVYSERDYYKFYKLIGNYFKNSLKNQGISAKYFGFSRKRKPQLTNVEIIKKNFICESAEVVACLSGEKFYIGITKAAHNPFEFKKRDVGRPAQRTIFSISPRLSNIMINLCKAKEGDVLLDPFCGVGTILQEAVLNGINICGLDIDEACVRSSKENLRWLSKEYNLSNLDEKIMQGDARKLSTYFEENSIDAIATEPYLGPPLKKKPSVGEVSKIFEEIEPLYEESLKGMYKVLKPGKRIAIVSPCIRTTKSKYVKFDLSGIAKKIGFKIINSLIDAEARHKTFREIFVLEKP